MTTLNQRIQKFYDQSTPLWINMWGEHMHHGHYGQDGKTQKIGLAAQEDLIIQLLEWSGVKAPAYILDAGCGVGGSARYLHKMFKSKVLGITLSPVQVNYANELTQSANIQDHVTFEVRDMMDLNHQDGPFDLIWSLESMEHIEDKRGLFEIFYNCLKPNGRIVIATWCTRAPHLKLEKSDIDLLSKIYKHYHLPEMTSINSLCEMAKGIGFKEIKSEDWTSAVAPFWNKVIDTALSWKGFKGLLLSGVSTIKGAWTMRYMKRGFETDLLKFGVITAVK